MLARVEVRYGDFWMCFAALLLAALLEAARLCRRARCAGYRDFPVGSIETVVDWLGSIDREVPAELRAVLRLSLDGGLGDAAVEVARDSATVLVRIRQTHDARGCASVVVVALDACRRLSATPPKVSVGEWFAACWLAEVMSPPSSNPFAHLRVVGAGDKRRVTATG